MGGVGTSGCGCEAVFLVAGLPIWVRSQEHVVQLLKHWIKSQETRDSSPVRLPADTFLPELQFSLL